MTAPDEVPPERAAGWREAALAGAGTALVVLLAEGFVACATRPSARAALAAGAPWRLLIPVLGLGVLAALAGRAAATPLGPRAILRGALLGAALPVLVHPALSPPALLLAWIPAGAVPAALALPLLVALPLAAGRRAAVLTAVTAFLAGTVTWFLVAAGGDVPPPGAPADEGWLVQLGPAAGLGTLGAMAVVLALPLALALRDAARADATRGLLVADALLAAAVGLAWLLPRAGGDGARPDGPPPRPPVLLVVADTLRADHVAGFGGDPSLTPALAALARDGVSFTAAWAPAPWTTPSFGSLLTGRLPLDHGAGAGGTGALQPGAATLAESLAARGWWTAALTSNPLLGRQHGLARGFVRYENAVPPEWYLPVSSWVMDRALDAARPYLDGASQAARALAAVDEARAADRSWMVLAHLMDTHWPHDAAARLREPGAEGLPADYRAGVRAVDEALGALLDGLRARGLYDGTLIVFTADHGEELDEARAASARRPPSNLHGHTLHEELLHVPLVVKLPAGDARLGPPGAVRSEPVSLLDLAPTVLEALGELPPAGLAGRSLLAGGAGTVFAEALLPDAGEALAARRGALKVVVRGLPPRPENAQAFDLGADPGERTPLALDARPEFGELYDALVVRWLRLPAGRPAAADARAEALDEDARRRLQQLGYLR